jgi:ABC-type Fe3+/spermidine/putrescine transport system ATPase subunit
MKDVVLAGVEKTYSATSGGSGVPAVRGVDLTIAAGEFFVLLGASGSGKTTLLRCIAGLEAITGGEIRIGAMTVASGNRVVPAVRRNIGMVFQDYAIWPHMTVGENVEFALRHARSGSLRGDAAKKRVLEVLEVVGLEEFVDRGSTYLSGGQQQRVALARAVVAKPDVLLLDEPLSNLDARLRANMRKELRRITSELGVTSIYVTHDQIEALVMADRIAVMRHGEVLQVGTPEEIYRTPADLFVGEFVGEANLVPGRVLSDASSPPECDEDQRFVAVETPYGTMTALAGTGATPGERVRLLIRPESLHVCHDGSAPLAPGWNAVTGLVRGADFAGAHTELTVDVDGVELRAQAHSFDAVSVGSPVTLTVGAQWVIALGDHPTATSPGPAAEEKSLVERPQ